MVKLGLDLFDGWDSYSGYQHDGVLTGISLTQESGTGAAPKYRVVSQMPVVGVLPNPLAGLNDTRAVADISEVGYYKATTGSHVIVELGATSRAGFYQYKFPAGKQASVVIDVSHVLPSFRGQGLSQNYLRGNITTSSNHYEGFGVYDNGCNLASA